jgi:hypothetical protein
VALKATLLVNMPGGDSSSFCATRTRVFTAPPVYTASSVSNALPCVSIVVLPFAGAVHCHHTDAPPAFPPWLGSPASLFAPALVPVTVALLPRMMVAAAKLLFTGPDALPAGAVKL